MGRAEAAAKLADDKKLSDQCVEYAQLKGRHVVLKDIKYNPMSVARAESYGATMGSAAIPA